MAGSSEGGEGGVGDLLDEEAVGLGHLAKGQADFVRTDDAGAHHAMLHGYRVRFDEQRLEDVGQLIVQDLRFGELLRARELGELRHRAGDEVGRDRDDALGTDLGEGQGQGIVAAEDDEFWVRLAHEARGLLDLATGFLDADDVRMLLPEAQGGLDGDLDAAATGDGIKDDRLRRGFGEQGKVTEEPFPAGLIILRGDEQERIGAGFVGGRGQVGGDRNSGGEGKGEVRRVCRRL
ncbi:MAG: hypothetical protein AN484_26240 [Aphanizomenon flos-aquae WA102]|uniref:Uncharacterized protein n=1 Tax=Aphanizomenon flos-aquae WA102 TaxID=1710896 RepID=A0A1B7WEA7_APHFL|nr:MAG: hypothetical protein AN484_26240 [Aphanizomenon flos-aquae WA102]